MNGDSYSSRGMASANALPRIRKHETDTNNPMGADSGRYGSSRDHYVSSKISTRFQQANKFLLLSRQGTTDEIEIEKTTGAVIGDAQDPPDIEIHDGVNPM